MPRTIRLTHTYDIDPDDLFRIATDMDVLCKLSEGLIHYRGMPKGPFIKGQEVTVQFSLLGRLPWADYHIHVQTRDDAARVFSTQEHGGPLKLWCHHLEVKATETGACLSEVIEIDAGFLSLAYKWWGLFMYARRHRARVAYLNALTNG